MTHPLDIPRLPLHCQAAVGDASAADAEVANDDATKRASHGDMQSRANLFVLGHTHDVIFRTVEGQNLAPQHKHILDYWKVGISLSNP